MHYLALDQQEKAVALLEEALVVFEGEERIELLFELAMYMMIMKSLKKYLIA